MSMADVPVIALACFGAGVTGAVLLPRRIMTGVFLLYAVGALAIAFWAFQGGSLDTTFTISSALVFHFRTGGLGLFFSLVLSVVSVAISVYSVGYSTHTGRPRVHTVIYGMFLLSMYAVFMAADILTFLIAWEVMSLVSYFLVTDRIEDTNTSRVGLLYALMTHAGTAAIIAAFFIMARTAGSMEFESIAEAMSTASPGIRSTVFLLCLAGFGTKAGIVPLHVWLPEAHPAAPSNASALMSGVMIKSGIFGILLVTFQLLGAPESWWGMTVLVIGAISSVLGILYALMENDIKRLLAYSSVENIGIILLGIGASMVFASYDMTALASLGLAAALYHTLNHAVFKGLLFLGSGSIVHAMRTKNIEKMGGLIKRMPWTALFFLVGSVAICALPPFNGFMSEWLTFQSLVLGIKPPAASINMIMILSGAALALTGALAAACFVKAFGITFLGLPRSSDAEKATESSISMRAGMALLAVLCLVLGTTPAYVIGRIGDIGLPALSGAKLISSEGSILTATVTAPGDFSAFSPMLLAVIMAAGAVVVLAALRLLFGRGRATVGDAWDCGLGRLTPRMQYSSTAFTHPIRVIFQRLYRPTRESRISYSVKPLFVKSLRYQSVIRPVFERWLYQPVVRVMHWVSGRIQLLQSGSLHLYLGYILATLVVLLLVWR